jgi:hypothetical protein
MDDGSAASAMVKGRADAVAASAQHPNANTIAARRAVLPPAGRGGLSRASRGSGLDKGIWRYLLFTGSRDRWKALAARSLLDGHDEPHTLSATSKGNAHLAFIPSARQRYA